ncbi:MAG TPA: VWA domain-containing protein [Pyrinomonadaceae bacterium]|nr:VWA domain-containing protein [Pyrinomonadaceae bacterium]
MCKGSEKLKRNWPTLALLLGALLLSCLPVEAQKKKTTATTTTARRQQRRTTTTTATSSRVARTSPTPIAVPRLSPARRTSQAIAVPTQTTPTVQQSAPQTTTQQQPPAQTPAPQPTPAPAETLEDEDEVIRVTSNLVVVPVSVTNAAGEPVQGLQKSDFRLEEEGRAQEVAEMGDPDQVPLDIAILFDISSSVTQKSFFTFQQESAVRFLKQVLKPTDRAAVFTISDRPRLEQPLSSAEVSTMKILTIPAASSPTPTAFYDTVKAAARYLAENAPGRHRRVILVITDGDDNFSDIVRETTVAEARAQGRGDAVPAEARRHLQERHRRAVSDVQRAVQQADAVFYSINPGGPSVRLNEISTRAQKGMEQVAETTGGSSFVPERLENLDAVFRQIAAELRGQYLLQYYSTSDAPPGKYLSIKVRTPTRTDLRVRARQGYYVPRPK